MKLFLTLLLLVAVTSTATAGETCPVGRGYIETVDKNNRTVRLIPFRSIGQVYRGVGTLNHHGRNFGITTAQIECYKKWLDNRSRRQGY